MELYQAINLYKSKTDELFQKHEGNKEEFSYELAAYKRSLQLDYKSRYIGLGKVKVTGVFKNEPVNQILGIDKDYKFYPIS